MEISQRIKQRRKELGLTLKDVAERLGVSESLISRYESREVRNMGIDKIKPLAEILNTTPAYLMGWTDEQPKAALDDIFESYNLSAAELAEFEKIKQMNMLMFNGKEVSEASREKLNNTLKEIFIESLLEKRKKEQ